MFGDLDWPINASRRFVSVSWASCLFKRERARNETKKLRSFLWQWQEPCDGKKWLPGHVPGAIDSNPSDRSVIDSYISASRSSARVIIGVYGSMHSLHTAHCDTQWVATVVCMWHTTGVRTSITWTMIHYSSAQLIICDDQNLHGMIAVDVQLN